MKFALVAAALAAIVVPVAAQDVEGMPLIRVYMDTPYFYDIIASNIDSSNPQAISIDLVVEGKEVGSSTVLYSCETGDYTETVTSDWTGGADRFIPTALMAYGTMFC